MYLLCENLYQWRTKLNYCVLKGKVIEDIQLKFLYNSKRISIARTKLELVNGSIIAIKGYDEMADWMYRNLKNGVNIIISGKIRDLLEIEVEYIKIIK